MIADKKTLRTCPNGHQYYKSSNCPVCPTCEQERKLEVEFLMALAAPARRALENKGLTTLPQLAACTEKEILNLHGMGPGSLPKLRQALAAQELSFQP